MRAQFAIKAGRVELQQPAAGIDREFSEDRPIMRGPKWSSGSARKRIEPQVLDQSFMTHDVAPVASIADSIVTMHRGSALRSQEQGSPFQAS